MSTRENVIEAITDYENQFRRQNLAKLEVSAFYRLNPNRINASIALAGTFDKDPWPNSDRCGV